jgi:hypothetical protein
VLLQFSLGVGLFSEETLEGKKLQKLAPDIQP